MGLVKNLGEHTNHEMSEEDKQKTDSMLSHFTFLILHRKLPEALVHILLHSVLPLLSSQCVKRALVLLQTLCWVGPDHVCKSKKKVINILVKNYKII